MNKNNFVESESRTNYINVSLMNLSYHSRFVKMAILVNFLFFIALLWNRYKVIASAIFSCRNFQLVTFIKTVILEDKADSNHLKYGIAKHICLLLLLVMVAVARVSYV